jgi:hypothetical protein
VTVEPSSRQPGALDDQADLDRFTVFIRQRELDGIRVRVDCHAPALMRVASRANGLSGACQPGSRTGTPGYAL